MPDGEVIGFAHTILETAPGGRIDQRFEWKRRNFPIVPAAAPQIDLATMDDAERLTALAIKDVDWSTRLTAVLRERGAESVEVTVAWHDDRGTGFFTGQGWKQRVRVYSRSLRPPGASPKGWRARLRAWLKRFQTEPIN